MESTSRRPRINGRRGAFQIVFGSFYTIVGLSFFAAPNTAAIDRYFFWLTQYVPLGFFAALWIIAGAIALVCAFRPRPKDAAGFIAAVFAPGIWAGLFFVAAAVTGGAQAFVQGVVYAVFSVIPLIVSGMQGPTDRDHREVSR